MRISDWSSDVCSSDLVGPAVGVPASARERRIAYGMASRLIGALHFQTVCAELVEAPFFLLDARKEDRPFDKLRTNGSYFSGNTQSAPIAAICVSNRRPLNAPDSTEERQ